MNRHPQPTRDVPFEVNVGWASAVMLGPMLPARASRRLSLVLPAFSDEGGNISPDAPLADGVRTLATHLSRVR